MTPPPGPEWTRPALFLRSDASRSAAGDVVVLDGEEGRHAADVRRLRVGEVVLVGDGAGVRLRVEVIGVGKGRLEGRVLERRADEAPALRVTVVQALVKGDRGELAVELATEAGADTLVPWRAERSIARWDDGPRGEKALQKWRVTAREAAKQARRAFVPEVAEPTTTAGLVDRVRASDATVLADGTATESLATVALPTVGELLLVVGPEGGVTDAERDALARVGAVPVRMGPAVLRTSSAAAVALGALGARTGRWSGSSSATTTGSA